jgi:hypothetical protein
MPTKIHQGLCLSNNRVHQGELALVWSSYWKTWSRLLYDYNGTYVEVDLTPIQPERQLSWEKVRQVNIRRHYTKPQITDRLYKCVQPGTLVWNDLMNALENHLSPEKMAELLFRDFLPEIDWSLYRQYNHGGVFFADVMLKQHHEGT